MRLTQLPVISFCHFPVSRRREGGSASPHLGARPTEYNRQGHPDSSPNLADCHKLVLCGSAPRVAIVLLLRLSLDRQITWVGRPFAGAPLRSSRKAPSCRPLTSALLNASANTRARAFCHQGLRRRFPARSSPGRAGGACPTQNSSGVRGRDLRDRSSTRTPAPHSCTRATSFCLSDSRCTNAQRSSRLPESSACAPQASGLARGSGSYAPG